MTIKQFIEQTCDRCMERREIASAEQANTSGWREVKAGKHLCSNCIHRILEEVPQ